MPLPDRTLRSADLPGTHGEELVAARERVIALLTDRFADDSLTVDEFEARLARLHSATTVTELDLLVRDLTQGSPVRAPAPFVSSRQVVQPPREGRLIAILTESKRTGPWVMPLCLEVVVVLGDIMLDLRDAVLPPGGCEISLHAAVGQVRLLVPPGVVVDDQLAPLLCTVRNDAEHASDHLLPGPRIRLTGVAGISEVEVRVAPSGERPKEAWKKAKPR